MNQYWSNQLVHITNKAGFPPLHGNEWMNDEQKCGSSSSIYSAACDSPIWRWEGSIHFFRIAYAALVTIATRYRSRIMAISEANCVMHIRPYQLDIDCKHNAMNG